MSQNNGPVMLVATSVLRGHKTRIGKIGGNITLPRAVELSTLLAVGAGMIVGLIVAGVLNPGPRGYMYGALFGGGLGWLFMNYSPLQGESLLKWLGLTINSKRQEIKVDGQPVRLAIGVAYLSEPAKGKVSVRKSAINVQASQFDERGVQISAKNLNMQMYQNRSRDAAATVTQPTGAPLPTNADISLESKSNKKTSLLSRVKKDESTDTGPIKTGRLAAARAAQEGADQEYAGEVPAGWNGAKHRTATVTADPFATPAAHLPTQHPEKALKETKPGKDKKVKVPEQAGPIDANPLNAKPRKLPR